MAGAYNLKSPEEVKEYLKNLHTEYQFGCYNEKKPEVCHLLGDYAESVESDYKRAGTVYKSTCDNYNFAKSCAKYGSFLMFGRGCEKNQDEAYKYWDKACTFNDDKGCFYAASLIITDKTFGKDDRGTHIAKAEKMLKKSCHELNYEKACFHLSALYLGGLEPYLHKNYKEAYKLSLKCCEIGNPFACANISQMHARGEGAQKNTELAEIFKKRAELLHDELVKQRKQLRFHQGLDM